MIQFNVQLFGQRRRAVTDAQPHRKDYNVKFFSNAVALFVDIADEMSSIFIPGFNMRDSRFDKSNTQILFGAVVIPLKILAKGSNINIKNGRI